MPRLAVAATAFAALAAIALPANAAPNCQADDGPGLHITFGVGIGGPYTREEQEVFDKMELRKHGIDAATVERTEMDCFKITRIENGRWVTEYYDAKTLEFQPLNLRLPE